VAPPAGTITALRTGHIAAPSREGASLARDPVLRALAVGALLTAGWVLFGPFADTASWFVQATLDVVFIWFAWRVAEAADTDRSMRRFWRGVSFGTVFFLVGDLVQTVLAATDPAVNAAPGTAQTVLVATGVGCVVWVLLTHPIRVAGRERLRLWLDAATVMCATGVFAWYLSLTGPTPETAPQIAVALVGSALMLVAAFGLCRLLLSGDAPFTFRAGAAGVISAALVGLDTSLHPVLAEPSGPRLLLLTRLLPCFLLAATPRIQQLDLRADPSALAARIRRRYSRLPYIAVGATQALLLADLATSGLTLRGWGVVLGAAGIMGLVVVRQTVAIADNAQLLQRLDTSLLTLRRQERRFRSLVQHASDITLILDRHGRVTYASPALTRVLGVDPESASPVDPSGLVHPDDRPIVDRMLDRLRSGQSTVTAQLRARHVDGAWRWLQLVATNLLADDSVGGIIVNARDVTEERQLQERLRFDATHDALTSLANRALFNEQVRLIAGQAPYSETPTAILAIDLDDFKPVNDLLGHHVGDALLVAVAERLRRCLLPTDTVARLGGDEFAVLLPATSHAGAAAVADRILAAFTEPVRVERHELPIRASIGIAVGTGTRIETLLRDADAAMYTVKHNGKGRYLHAPLPR
jgi:diguanylate cyclase (GGDEF)-like protein/PAS domain S-box-containing protein